MDIILSTSTITDDLWVDEFGVVPYESVDRLTLSRSYDHLRPITLDPIRNINYHSDSYIVERYITSLDDQIEDEREVL